MPWIRCVLFLDSRQRFLNQWLSARKVLDSYVAKLKFLASGLFMNLRKAFLRSRPSRMVVCRLYFINIYTGRHARECRLPNDGCQLVTSLTRRRSCNVQLLYNTRNPNAFFVSSRLLVLLVLFVDSFLPPTIEFDAPPTDSEIT